MTLEEHRTTDSETRATIESAVRQTLFVEAGAGTGKTRALVDRFVAHLLAGVPVDQIAAITFTEKAAAELRERVRERLEEHAAGGDAPPLVVAALESLDRAQISTIHSFCQSLLRSLAAEAGVDPDFVVQDEVLTERRRQDRWRSFLEGLAGDEIAGQAVDRVLSLGLYSSDLEKLAFDLASQGDLASLLEQHPLTAPEPEWPDVEAMERQLATALGWNVRADDLYHKLAALAAVVAALVFSNGNREAVLAAGAGALHQKWNVGRRENWGGRIDEVRSLAAEIDQQLWSLLARIRSAALAAVLPYLVRFVRQDELERGREGSLTFDDLILRTRDVLHKSPAARLFFRRRFAVLLIDEFQDTDPLQVEIALAFARDPATGEMEAGRLFLVGDPKQSIYRFRRADMAVYSATREVMESAQAAMLQLALNRRSRVCILEWVNAVFHKVIGAADDSDVQPPYAPVHAERSGELRGPGVAWFGTMTEMKARELRVLEAGEVSRLCRRAVEVERWQVEERDGTVREARYRDIAILIPRRTGLTALERALAAHGVPYRVEGGSLIYRTQEVRDLINCLTAIDDPADEVAVVASLRSPAFACSDVELVQHKAAGGSFNYRHPALAEMQGPVAEALRTLLRYHEKRHDGSLASLIGQFTAECGQIETGILFQGDRNAFRRVRFVIEQARAFEAAGPESLRSFVTWLEKQAAAAILDNEGAGADDDEDAARILTIHGAKGLEFPIVIMAGLSVAPNTSRYPPFMRDHASGAVAVRAGTDSGKRVFVLGDCERLKELEGRHEEAEFARLLYVAATRARDHLVVSLHHPKRASSCGAQLLINAGATEQARPLAVGETPGGPPQRPFDALEVAAPERADDFAEQRAALIREAHHLRYTSATALKASGGAEEEPEKRKEDREDESEPWSRGRAGTRVGRAVHAAIQSLPWDADDKAAEAFCRAQAVAEAVPHRTRDVESLVRWLMRESGAWKRAREAKRAFREVPFALRIDGTTVEGYIDLVIDSADGLEIIDWKTDAIAADEVESRMADYRLQAGLYVCGLEAATGRKVARVSYVFAFPGIEVDAGDPVQLAENARAAVLRAS